MRKMTDGGWDVSGEAVAVLASRKGCGPCARMEPAMAGLEAEMGARLDFAEADADECRESLGAIAVRSVPTVVLFVRGKEAGRWSGFADKRRMRLWLEAALAASGA